MTVDRPADKPQGLNVWLVLKNPRKGQLTAMENQGYFKVQQKMQIVVYGIYPAGTKKILPPGIPLAPPDAHGHTHETANDINPNLQPDPVGFVNSRPVFDPKKAIQDSLLYSDYPGTAMAVFKNATDEVIKKFGKKNLEAVRVEQQFVTVVYLANKPYIALRWDSITEAPPGEIKLGTAVVVNPSFPAYRLKPGEWQKDATWKSFCRGRLEVPPGFDD